MERKLEQVPEFEMLLTAESRGVKFEQPFNNLFDYLVRAKELEEMGMKITSWYDKNRLATLS